jgi:hypothetical protein
MRKSLLAPVLAAVAALALAVPAGGAPAARAPGPSDCGSRQSCFYGAVNYGNPEDAVTNSTNENTWTSIPAANRKSTWEAGGSDLFVWDEQDKVWSCIQNGGSGLPAEAVAFGWYYIDYGVTASCDTLSLPPGAPGASLTARRAVLLSGRVSFMCQQSDICWYSGTNWTGTVDVTDFAEQDANSASWERIPSAEKGSVTVTSGALQIVVYAADSGTHQVISPGSRTPLNNVFGWWCAGSWGGANNCDHNLPASGS